MRRPEEVEQEIKNERYTTNAFPDNYGAPGLTKREYFAAMALQGILSRYDYVSKDAATHAILYADALIKELEK